METRENRKIFVKENNKKPKKFYENVDLSFTLDHQIQLIKH